jgi:hypothetical protein
MGKISMVDISGGESKEIKDLKININITKGFLNFVKKIDSLPNMDKTPYAETRSFYQAVSKDRDLNSLEKQLEDFFGPPIKPAGKPIPMMLRNNPSVKYLNGLREEQTLFIRKVKQGLYYGALWPWQRKENNITVHLGFCSHKMSKQEYNRIEKLAKIKVLNERIFKELDSSMKSQVQGISLASFLQMAEMEKTTCTLKIQTDNDVGYLHLLNGALVSAETGKFKNKEAAFRIISWDETVINLEKASNKKKNEINLPIIDILKEGLTIREKGEHTTTQEAQIDSSGAEKIQPDESERIDAAKKLKEKRFLPMAVSVLVTLIIISLGTIIFLRMRESKPIKDEYKSVLLNVENQQELEEKVKILQNFVKSHSQNKFTAKAEEKIKEIHNFIFQSTMDDADKLRINNDYEKAAAVYTKYLKKYPTGNYSSLIRQKIAEISLVIDNRDYDELLKLSQDNNIERIYSYVQYLEKHPKGQHLDEVEQLVLDMAEEYYTFFSKEINICENQENWEKCFQLCSTYINIYPKYKRTDEISSLRDSFLNKLRDKRKLAKLIKNAEQKGTDYKAARLIYLDYLKSHPDTTLKDKIIYELARLKEQAKLARIQNETKKIVVLLKDTDRRFADNQNGTVTDTKTGLMWCIVDSMLELQGCLNYESAVKYVKDLKTGGHQDWRLPTENELAGIYKNEPFFPPRKAEWYWTSKTYLRYSDGWQKMVHIVSTKREPDWAKEQIDSRECGAVHAVRP